MIIGNASFNKGPIRLATNGNDVSILYRLKTHMADRSANLKQASGYNLRQAPL